MQRWQMPDLQPNSWKLWLFIEDKDLPVYIFQILIGFLLNPECTLTYSVNSRGTTRGGASPGNFEGGGRRPPPSAEWEKMANIKYKPKISLALRASFIIEILTIFFFPIWKKVSHTLIILCQKKSIYINNMLCFMGINTIPFRVQKTADLRRNCILW